jgi:hypothetical protein
MLSHQQFDEQFVSDAAIEQAPSEAAPRPTVPDWDVEATAWEILGELDAAEVGRPRAVPEWGGLAHLSVWNPERPVKLWTYDALTQHEAGEQADHHCLALDVCERPEELAGCGLAVLHLDGLHPFGDAEAIYQAARKATAGTDCELMGITYNEEHPLTGRISLFRTVADVLTAIATGRQP